MSEESRSTLIFILWLFTAVVLVALFISAASQRELTAGHLAFASVLLAIAAAGTPYILRQPIIGEKPKRRVDALLDNLSDDDLLELKRRLSDIREDEAPLTDYLGDDGELVRRR